MSEPELTETERFLYDMTKGASIYVEETESNRDSVDFGTITPHFKAMQRLEELGLVQMIEVLNEHTIWRRTDDLDALAQTAGSN